MRLSFALACVIVIGCSGCLQSSYLLQAIAGQDDISWRARPIDEVLEDESVSLYTRQMLSLIGDVKRFGEEHALQPTGNYREYVALDRDAAVWVVSASHPLRFESLTWWFPIVGSVPYLGWFDERYATRFADDLRAKGWDVDLRGASAYSTLGWFDDPILSTMIPRHAGGVGDLVGVTLHESVHATHYVSGQTYFNEALADYVGDLLAMDYLLNRLQIDRWQLLAYQQAQDDREKRALRFHQAYKQLEALYASNASDGAKLRDKARIVERLRVEMGFWRPVNNAVLAQSRQYHGAKPPFDKLLAHCGRDWRRFWIVVARIDESSFSEPQQVAVESVIEPLLKAPCPSS